MRCFGVGDVADVRIDSREHVDLRVEASMRGKRSQLLHTEQDVEALVEALLEEQLQAGVEWEVIVLAGDGAVVRRSICDVPIPLHTRSIHRWLPLTVEFCS